MDVTALEVLVEIKKDCKGKYIDPKIETRQRNQGILSAVESKLDKVSKASEEKSSDLSSDCKTSEVDDTNGDITLGKVKKSELQNLFFYATILLINAIMQNILLYKVFIEINLIVLTSG